MPLEADYEFGKSAVAAGQLSQDYLEECIEVLVALERVGSQKRLWDIVVRKGYMSAEDAAKLRRDPGAAAGRTPAAPAAKREEEDTEEALPVVEQADAYVVAVLERGGKARLDRLPPRTVTIGRHPDCDLMLSDPDAAPQHAHLRFSGGGFVAEALGPASLAVNDRRTRGNGSGCMMSCSWRARWSCSCRSTATGLFRSRRGRRSRVNPWRG